MLQLYKMCVTDLWSGLGLVWIQNQLAAALHLIMSGLSSLQYRPDAPCQMWLVLLNCSRSCSSVWCSSSFRPVASQNLRAAPGVCATSEAKWRSEINELWTTCRSSLQSQANCVRFLLKQCGCVCVFVCVSVCLCECVCVSVCMCVYICVLQWNVLKFWLLLIYY